MNTTVYGDFHNATGSSNPETLVADYLASAPTEWRQQMEAIGAVDAIVEDYVSAIDAALPDNVWLSGSEFIGPHHTDEDYEDAPSMDDIRELLADIDLGAIVERHGTAADETAKQAVATAAAARAAAVEQLAAADKALTDAVGHALKLDIAATTIAELLGVTRARVYQIRDGRR